MISTKPAALIRVSLPTQSEAEQSLIAQGISDHNLRDSILELNKLLGNQDTVAVNPGIASCVKKLWDAIPEAANRFVISLNSWIGERQTNGVAVPETAFIQKLVDLTLLSKDGGLVSQLSSFETARLQNSGPALSNADLDIFGKYKNECGRIIRQATAVQGELAFRPEANPEIASKSAWVAQHNFCVENRRESFEGQKLAKLCKQLSETANIDTEGRLLKPLALASHFLANAGYLAQDFVLLTQAIKNSSYNDINLARSICCLSESRRRAAQPITKEDLDSLCLVISADHTGSYAAENLDLLSEVLIQRSKISAKSVDTNEIRVLAKCIAALSSEHFYSSRETQSYINFARDRLSHPENTAAFSVDDLTFLANFKSIKNWPTRCVAYSNVIQALPALQQQMDTDKQGCLSASRLCQISDLCLSFSASFPDQDGLPFSNIFNSFIAYIDGRSSFPSNEEFKLLSSAISGHTSGDLLLSCLTSIRKSGGLTQECPSTELLAALSSHLRAECASPTTLITLLKEGNNSGVSELDLAQHITTYTELLSSLNLSKQYELNRRIPEVNTLLGSENSLSNVTDILQQIVTAADQQKIGIAELKLSVS
jgi:hypothetical protein